MVQGLIGRKLGMTQLFEENGRAVPVTVVEAGPCVIVQHKTADRDGYEAVQLGLVDAKASKGANKPLRGHHDKAGIPPTRLLREFAIADGTEVKLGDAVSVEIFEGIGRVDIIGTSKGRGFQGVMKRHGFGGGRASHGSMFHRAPGSIGQSAWPSKVMRGMRGPGHMGAEQITAKNVDIIRVDTEKNLLLLRGSVPGSKGGMLEIRPAKSGSAAKGE